MKCVATVMEPRIVFLQPKLQAIPRWTQDESCCDVVTLRQSADGPERAEGRRAEDVRTPALPQHCPPAALPGAADRGDLKTAMDASVAALPPSFSRMPPDGHEFPQNYNEEVAAMPSKTQGDAPPPDLPLLMFQDALKEAPMLPPLPASEPPQRRYSFRLDSALEILPSKKMFPEDAKPSRVSSWRQDEKSERSVRDKIAMFQAVPDAPLSPAGGFAPGKLSKYKSSDDVFYDEDDADCVRNLPSAKLFSRSVVSVDKIGGFRKGLDYTTRTQSSMDLTSSSSSAYSSSCSPDSSLSSTTSSYLGYSSTLPRKSSRDCKTEPKSMAPARPGMTRTTSFTSGTGLHARSQSLLDVTPDPKQSSLNLLVEQRRKNLSKLRGLVIPEKVTETPTTHAIFDLPEIKSRDSILTSKPPATYKEDHKPSVNGHAKWAVDTSLASPPWKAPSQTPNLPKYSPAFKRKSISIYGTEALKAATPAKPPRSFANGCGKPLEAAQDPAKLRLTSEDESDNDSAVSSSRSSMSHGFSPPASPLLDAQRHLLASPLLGGDKTPLSRTLSSETTASGASTTSTLTSGSQASCSSNGSSSDGSNRRVLKAQSVEAINRKNVLTSAKYSRGFDLKNGSPLIQRKLIGETEKPVEDDPFEDGNEDKESVLSFGSSHTLESYSVGEESYAVRKYSTGSNGSVAKETVSYTLAESFKPSGKTTDVKIAFLNHVDATDGCCEGKKKVEKTESSPCPAASLPQPAPRRTSVPFAAPLPWRQGPGEPWPRTNGSEPEPHSPLVSKTSSESLRSRASSVDTIIDKYDYEYRPTEASKRDSEEKSFDGPLYGRYQSAVEAPQAKEPTEKIANARSRRSVSVNDIRKAFEKAELVLSSTGRTVVPKAFPNGNHARVSSLDSTTSEDSCALTPGHYGSSSNLHRERDQYGSITSLASSTSLISPQELQTLIDEANQTLDESGGTAGGCSSFNHDVLVVILHRDTAGGSVGITLAGGADYEAKEITVHKVLAGSPADRDGRVQKGDRILSINGKSMKGATHRESLTILKAPRPEVVLVVSRLKAEAPSDAPSAHTAQSAPAALVTPDDSLVTSLRASLNGGATRPPRIVEGTMLTDTVEEGEPGVARGPPTALVLLKDGAGLGFSLEGGKDSPLGDRPLVIKKIFTGGAAEKSGQLFAGDELLSVDGVDVVPMSRIEAWKLMKRIPDGHVSVTVRHRVENRPSA